MADRRSTCGRRKLAARAARRWTAFVALALPVVGLISLPGTSAARSDLETLRLGVSAYIVADYGRAEELLSGVVEDPTTLRESDQALAFMYLASIRSVNGATTAATAQLRRCLEIEPNYNPDARLFPSSIVERFADLQEQETGFLRVTTRPPEVEISIDGRKVGVTPYEGRVLAGQRVVLLETARFRSILEIIPVAAQETATFEDVAMQRKEARLHIEVIPRRATIQLNGAELSENPAAVDVAEGFHIVSGFLRGYVGKPDTVLVRDRDTREVTLMLAETPEHQRQREEQELHAEARRIHDSMARRKSLTTAVGVGGTLGGLALAWYQRSEADEALDQYRAAVDPDVIDSSYSAYERHLRNSNIALAVSAGMAAIATWGLLQEVPSLETVLSRLVHERGLTLGLEVNAQGGGSVVARLRI